MADWRHGIRARAAGRRRAAGGRLDGHRLARASRPSRPQPRPRRMPCARPPPTSATAPTARRACWPGTAPTCSGVLLDVSSPFHAELVRALDSASADRGLDLVLGTTTPRTDEHRAAETLLDFRCEALVLLGPQMADADLTALASLCPIVVVGRAGRRGRHRGAGRRRPGAGGGRRPPGVAGAPSHRVRRRAAGQHRPGAPSGLPRRDGSARPAARDSDVVPGGANEAAGVAAARRLLVAIRAATDRRRSSPSTTGSRSGCATPCCARAVVCPRTVSVVGYDDSPMARLGTDRPDLGQPGARGAGRCHGRGRRGPARRRHGGRRRRHHAAPGRRPPRPPPGRG